MELPHALRRGVDKALEGIALSDLARAAGALSQRYRGEVRDSRFHLSDDLAARAYLATRLPATYAATRAAMAKVAEARPDFAPLTLLDLGAGPGSALWAASECWPGLDDALMMEASAPIRKWGEELCASAPLRKTAWHDADISKELPHVAPRDLVTLAYVLGELAPVTTDRLVDRLWDMTAGVLLIVEPGTPAGWQRILQARHQLIALDAHLLAPCPHRSPCPLSAPGWCHFSRRVSRSRLHREAKRGEVPWEDEKFIYIAASRKPGIVPGARVIAPPRAAKGRIDLKLCMSTGEAANRTLSRRDGDAFRIARHSAWGDGLL